MTIELFLTLVLLALFIIVVLGALDYFTGDDE